MFQNKKTQKRLFFIALIPPTNVQKYANKIKQHFAQNYNSLAALKSPPHITLKPPFHWHLDDLTLLEKALHSFTQSQASFPVKLDSFSSFPPRVIYLDVHQTDELMNLQKNLVQFLEFSLQIVDRRKKSQSFTPHLTVGFKDLSPPNFALAWEEFKTEKVAFNFLADKLVLLLHNRGKWEIKNEFYFR